MTYASGTMPGGLDRMRLAPDRAVLSMVGSMNEVLKAAIPGVLARSHADVPSQDDFERALRQPLNTGLTRWELWPLVAFLRHERRQKWVGYLVESKLRGSGVELAGKGALGHPEGFEQEGEVPDTPGWRYFYHGRGCCLSHDDGTSIDVDFADDGSATEIDPYFFSNYLASVPVLLWSDARLRLPPPLEEAWQIDITRLAALGLITHNWRFRLTDEGRQVGETLEPLADEIDRLATDRSPGARIRMAWVLAMVGDVVSATEVIPQDEGAIVANLRSSAATAVLQRAEMIRSLSNGPDERLCLQALASLGRKFVDERVWRILESEPPSSLHLASMRLIESWGDPVLESMLVCALKRFTPQRGFFGRLFHRTIAEPDEIERPRNGLLVAIARTLLSCQTPETISPETVDLLRRALLQDRKACDSEAGFLLYLLAPQAGLTKLRRNFRNRVPLAREEAAIFLAMIGTREALDALIEVASGSPEDGSHEAACSLSMLEGSRAQAAATEWVRRNDGYEEADGRELEVAGRTIKTWSADDMMRVNMRNWVQGWARRAQEQYGHLLPRWRPPRSGSS